jgi:large subunit ribosomal protein L29
MNVDKIRNLTDVELNHQQHELADQLFKMKFQLKMGQTESLKKIRELKKDIARVQTVMRQKQMASGNGTAAAQPEPVATPAAAEKPARRGLLRRKSK